MVNKHIRYRLGATAIAAVLALSSTPALSQVADPLGPTAEPVPADPSVVAAPPISEPAITVSTEPVVVDEPAAVAPAKPAPTVQRAKPARTTTARQITARAPAAAPTASADATEATVDTPPASPVAAPETTSPEMTPAPAPVETASPEPMNSDLPLMAGGAGLAAIALLGTGIVASRRRRRRDEFAYGQTQVEQPASEPQFDRPTQTQVAKEERSAFAWGRQSTPAANAGAAVSQTLPSGFDTSKFGRHVQAAYRGPTPDNPSLSLKRRLKRASFFDMKERQAGSSRSFARSPELMPV